MVRLYIYRVIYRKSEIGQYNIVKDFNGIKYHLAQFRKINGQLRSQYQHICTNNSLSSTLSPFLIIHQLKTHNGRMGVTENSRLITNKDASYAVKNCLFCIDHKWNKEKITLNLCIDQTLTKWMNTLLSETSAN